MRNSIPWQSLVFDPVEIKEDIIAAVTFRLTVDVAPERPNKERWAAFGLVPSLQLGHRGCAPVAALLAGDRAKIASAAAAASGYGDKTRAPLLALDTPAVLTALRAMVKAG